MSSRFPAFARVGRLIATISGLCLRLCFCLGAGLAHAGDPPARNIPSIGIPVILGGRTISVSQSSNQQQTIWTMNDITYPGALFIRLHVATVHWSGAVAPALQVLDTRGEPARTYSLVDVPADGFWLDPVRGTTLRLRLVAQASATHASVQFTLDRYIRGVLGGRLESVRDTKAPTFEPVSALTPGSPLATSAKAVAKIFFAGLQADSVCTGFLVGPDLMLTNEHCVPASASAESCRALKVSFGWDPAQGIAPATAYNCQAVTSDASLDYALVQLDRPAGNTWGILRLAQSPPKAHAAMAVIQYPFPDSGKKIARKNCVVDTVGVDGVASGMHADFSHTCDTDGGSSGSPVVGAKDGLVYGLHHWGFDLIGDYVALNRAVLMTELPSLPTGPNHISGGGTSR